MNNVIDLETEYGFLEIDKASIRLIIENNIFIPTAAPGFYSFPFSIPGTPNNHLRLGFAYLPESEKKLKRIIPVKMYSFGQFKQNALLYLEEYKSGIYDANLLPYSQKILGDLLEGSLRDLDFGVFNQFGLPEQYSYYLVKYVFATASDLGFEITSTGFYTFTYGETWSGDPEQMINDLIDQINGDVATHDFTASIYEGISSPSAGLYSFRLLLKGNTKYFTAPDVVQPLIYSSIEVQLQHLNLPNGGYWNILDHMNLTTKDTFLGDYEAIFDFKAEYRFPLIFDPFCYGVEEDPAKKHLLNYWHFADQRYLAQSGSLPNYPGAYSGVCPCVKLRFILETIFANLGYRMETRIFDDAEYENLILIATGICHNYDVLTYEYRGPQFIDLRKAMPSKSIKSFLDGVKGTLGLKFTYNFVTGTVTITKIQNILSSGKSIDYTSKLVGPVESITFDEYEEGVNMVFNFDSEDGFISSRTRQFSEENIEPAVADFASLPASGNDYGQVRLVEDEDKFYIFDVDGATLTGAWLYLCDNLVNYRIGAFQKELSTELTPVLQQKNVLQDSTFFQTAGGDATNLLIKVPAVYQMVKSPFQKAGQNDFGMKLAFWRGLQDNGKVSPVKYPMANHDEKDYNEAVLFNRSLKWDGEKGLFENNHKNFVNFMMKASKHQCYVKLTSDDIFALDQEKFFRFESTEYMTEKIDVVFNNATQEVSPSKVTMYKK